MNYHLPPHLRSCDMNGRTVLLDLASNRYRGLSGRTDIAFRAAIAGEQLDESLAPIVGRLCREGLLDRFPAARHVQMPPPAAGVFVPRSGRVRLSRIVEAFRATFVASRFKRLSLIDVENRFGCSRSRGSLRHGGEGVNIDEILMAYLAANVLLPSHDRCLERSISLAWTCSLHGHRANLIIGVSFPPFNAHAWVQSGQMVLNDTIERVQQYKPIHWI